MFARPRRQKSSTEQQRIVRQLTISPRLCGEPGPPGGQGWTRRALRQGDRKDRLAGPIPSQIYAWCTISIVLFQLTASFDLIQNSLGVGLNHRAESVVLLRTQSRNNIQK